MYQFGLALQEVTDDEARLLFDAHTVQHGGFPDPDCPVCRPLFGRLLIGEHTKRHGGVLDSDCGVCVDLAIIGFGVDIARIP
jgi:hypothetical protein